MRRLHTSSRSYPPGGRQITDYSRMAGFDRPLTLDVRFPERNFQDLQLEVAFTGSYQSVKRYVSKLRQTQPELVCRIEVQPAEDVQVDFGVGLILVGTDGKRHRTWILRVVLNHSRNRYNEVPSP